MTVFLDRVHIRGIVDTGEDATIVSSNDASRLTHWSYKPGPNTKGVGGL